MGGRAVIKLRYVHVFTDRTGKVRHYFRRHGKRTPLPGLPGSQEYMDAYAAAMAGERPPVQKHRAAPGTFAALASRYYTSSQYLRLSKVTRTNYRSVIDRFLEEHGHRRVDQMERGDVDNILGRMADRPGAAIVRLKRLRTLVRYAIALGWVTKDATAGVAAYKSGEFHTWTEPEIAQFEKHWKVGTKQRLAFALLLYTGQRGSDVHRMTWPDVAGDGINVVQQKTGETLEVPLHPTLADILRTTTRKHVAILVTDYGRPFSVKGFGNMMSRAIRKAGLPERCKAHGLRKAAARRLAEAGATEKQIGAITGHRTLAEIERYTRAANQKKLARDGLQRQLENESGKPQKADWQTPLQVIEK